MPAVSKVAHHSIMLPDDKRSTAVLENGKEAVLLHLSMFEDHFTTTGSKYLVGDELTAAGGNIHQSQLSRTMYNSH